MDDCACLYGGFDEWDEHPLTVQSIRKARKPHVCRECSKTIKPGERYEHYVGKHEGQLFTVKTCLVCQEIRKALYCDGWYFGSLWTDVKEQLFPKFSIACVDKLSTPEAKHELTRQFRKHLGLEA